MVRADIIDITDRTERGATVGVRICGGVVTVRNTVMDPVTVPDTRLWMIGIRRKSGTVSAAHLLPTDGYLWLKYGQKVLVTTKLARYAFP